MFGSRAIGGPAMQRDSLFRIASLTKPVTGVATLVLAAEGRLRLATVGPSDLASQPDPDTWIAGLGSLPLLAQPGERWFYNTSASVLGVLCARAAGQPFAEVLRSRIFEPLSMPDTGFWTTEPVG